MPLFDRLLSRPFFGRGINLSTSSSEQHTPARIFRKRSTMAGSSTATDMAASSTAAAVVDTAESNTAANLADPDFTAAVDIGKLLSDDQLEALNNIDVGDLLFVVKRAREVEENVSESEGNEHEDDDDDADGENDDDMVEGEQDANSSADEGGDGESEEEGEEDEEDEAPSVAAEVPTTPRMFIITAITSDDEDMITDVKLQRMIYSRVVDDSKPHTYQIYGDEIVHRHSIDRCNECNDTVSIATILSDPSYIVVQRPQGDNVRGMDHTISSNSRHQCISGCKDGWLKDRQLINSLIGDYDSPVLAWGGNIDDVPLVAAVCPVCVGREYLQEQEKLQAILLNTGRVDMDLVLTHQGDLNARRSALGYPFRQFDERLWGMHFDDMDGEEGEGEMEGGWDDPYEHFPEALDPNAYIKLNPASEATIEALPRKLFGETGSNAAKCGVCMDQLKEDSVVIILPCGHAEHHAECLELWLRQQETCTVCRRVVPAAKVVAQLFEEPAMEQKEEMEDGAVADEPLEGGEAITAGLRDVGSSQPDVSHSGKSVAVANSNVPELFSSSSWITEDGDVIMSD